MEKAKAVRRKSLKVLRGEYQKIKYFELPNPKSFGGDVISIAAQDDFAVTGVTVAIEDNTHTAVEQGAATFDAASGSWKYMATVDASAKSGLSVTATASDRPGNTVTLSATK
ncbi:MAG TPA: hypothetical protein VMD27_12525 [Candidatus Aquilonibacter sp.]|nr:hypothetical protein [Candidatus Aquilonibacter sp.]